MEQLSESRQAESNTPRVSRTSRWTDRVLRIIDGGLVLTFVGIILALGGGFVIDSRFFSLSIVSFHRPLGSFIVLVLLRSFLFKDRPWSFYRTTTIGELLRSADVLFVLITLLSVAMMFGELGTGSLKQFDEATYAAVARSMVESGEYLIPRHNTYPFFDKPILNFWLTALAFHLTGVHEWSARIVSATYGVLCILLVFWFGNRVYNSQTGALAALLLLSCTAFLRYSRLGMLDSAISFYSLLVLIAFWYLREKRMWWWVLGTALGLGFMTKSVVVLFPLCAIGLYCLCTAEPCRLFERSVWKAVGLMLVIVLPWHLVLFFTDSSLFLRSFIYNHLVLRMTTLFGAMPVPAFWYLDVLACETREWYLLLLPLSLILLIYRREIPNRGVTLYLTTAALFHFILITIVQTKHQWYIVPMLPVTSLVIGHLVIQGVRQRYHHVLYLFPLLIILFWHFYTPWEMSMDYNPLEKDIGLVLNHAVPAHVPVFSCHEMVNTFYFYGDREMIIVTRISEVKKLLNRIPPGEYVFMLMDTTDRCRGMRELFPQAFYQNSRFSLFRVLPGDLRLRKERIEASSLSVSP